MLRLDTSLFCSLLNVFVCWLTEMNTVSHHQLCLLTRASGNRTCYSFTALTCAWSMPLTRKQYTTCLYFSCVYFPMSAMWMQPLSFWVTNGKNPLRLADYQVEPGVETNAVYHWLPWGSDCCTGSYISRCVTYNVLTKHSKLASRPLQHEYILASQCCVWLRHLQHFTHRLYIVIGWQYTLNVHRVHCAYILVTSGLKISNFQH